MKKPKLAKKRVIYTITIDVTCADVNMFLHYIDEFMKDFPSYLQGLVASKNEKIKVVLDKKE